MRTDPYARTPAKLSKTGKTFALVLALHLGLLWLAQAVWTSEPAKAVREVVAAQLIQEFQAPAPPPPQVPPPPQEKQVPIPQATPVLPVQAVAPASLVQYALPAITAPESIPTRPAAALPVLAATTPAAPAAPPAPAKPAVVVAASRVDASCAKPRYPPASERLQEEGTVSLKFLIGENGQVLSGAVEKSSGYKRLDDAALAALSLCKFKPATVDGKPKQEWSFLRYRWELNE